MTRPIIHSLALIAAAVLWALALADAETWAGSSSLVIGVGLITAAAVAVVGVVAGSARWALRLGIGVAVAMVVLGAVVSLSPVTIGAVLLAGVALAGLAGTGMEGLVRKRPPADGPPPQAVLVALILLLAPMTWAVVSPDGLSAAVAITVGVSWITAVVWIKALPGSLLATRWIVPAIQIAAAFTSTVPTGAMILVGVGLLLRYAWTDAAKVAIHPLAEPGTRVPIPPELAPRDILDAAGIDDRGRRREEPR